MRMELRAVAAGGVQRRCCVCLAGVLRRRTCIFMPKLCDVGSHLSAAQLHVSKRVCNYLERSMHAAVATTCLELVDTWQGGLSVPALA